MNWQRASARDFKQLQAESDSELISQTWSTFSLNINVTSRLSVSNNFVWILDFMNLRNWRERHWKWASLSVWTSLTTRVLWRDGGCSDVWFKGSSSVRQSELLAADWLYKLCWSWFSCCLFPLSAATLTYLHVLQRAALSGVEKTNNHLSDHLLPHVQAISLISGGEAESSYSSVSPAAAWRLFFFS